MSRLLRGAVPFCFCFCFYFWLVTARPARKILVRGMVVARDGVLTWCGACVVVRALWCSTGVAMRARLEVGVPSGEGETLGFEALRSCVGQVVPGDVRLGEGHWAVLYDAAKLVLRWHDNEDGKGGGGWSVGRSGRLVGWLRIWLRSCSLLLGRKVDR